MHFSIKQQIKIPDILFQAINFKNYKAFIRLLLLSEGRAGEVWKTFNNLILFLLHPKQSASHFYPILHLRLLFHLSSKGHIMPSLAGKILT